MPMLTALHTCCATDALRAHACPCRSHPHLQALQVLVVANPANTNALILKENAPSIPPENITCLTRLDHNRALGQVGPSVAPALCLHVMVSWIIRSSSAASKEPTCLPQTVSCLTSLDR